MLALFLLFPKHQTVAIVEEKALKNTDPEVWSWNAAFMDDKRG